MNGIERVTGRPATLIDMFRSDFAKEARRVSGALKDWRMSSLGVLAKVVAAAEAMIVTPEYPVLVNALRAASMPASAADVARELKVLFACYPAKDLDIGVLVACAADEVIRARPSVLATSRCPKHPSRMQIPPEHRRGHRGVRRRRFGGHQSKADSRTFRPVRRSRGRLTGARRRETGQN
jgi:hypothetical protein